MYNIAISNLIFSMRHWLECFEIQSWNSCENSAENFSSAFLRPLRHWSRASIGTRKCTDWQHHPVHYTFWILCFQFCLYIHSLTKIIFISIYRSVSQSFTWKENKLTGVNRGLIGLGGSKYIGEFRMQYGRWERLLGILCSFDLLSLQFSLWVLF